MKNFFEIYLNKIIKEDINLSSKYIDKKFYQTFGHADVFLTSHFFNSFPQDYTRVNLFVSKFIQMANVNNLKKDTEFLVYDSDKKLAAIISVYLKGTYRYDIILGSTFLSDVHPSIQKTGQVRIIF